MLLGRVPEDWNRSGGGYALLCMPAGYFELDCLPHSGGETWEVERQERAMVRGSKETGGFFVLSFVF